MCVGASMLRQGWQCSSGITAGQLYSQIWSLRLRFSCFRDTSKGSGGAGGANQLIRDFTGKDYPINIKFVQTCICS